jgi:hypothetical protein
MYGTYGLFRRSAIGTRDARNTDAYCCTHLFPYALRKPASDFFADGALHIKQQGRNSCKVDF